MFKPPSTLQFLLYKVLGAWAQRIRNNLGSESFIFNGRAWQIFIIYSSISASESFFVALLLQSSQMF